MRVIFPHIDKILENDDVKIQELLNIGEIYKQIFKDIVIPLSTVQRKERKLLGLK